MKSLIRKIPRLGTFLKDCFSSKEQSISREKSHQIFEKSHFSIKFSREFNRCELQYKISVS